MTLDTRLTPVTYSTVLYALDRDRSHHENEIDRYTRWSETRDGYSTPNIEAAIAGHHSVLANIIKARAELRQLFGDE